MAVRIKPACRRTPAEAVRPRERVDLSVCDPWLPQTYPLPHPCEKCGLGSFLLWYVLR
jgi:hypothetical protein